MRVVDMRTNTTAAAVVAAALLSIVPAVTAKPEGKTVQYKFEKRYLEKIPATGGRRLLKRQTVNTAIDNGQLLYLINATVGTPPQSITMQLDTGSSDIWIPDQDSQICQSRQYGEYCQGGSYSPSSSSTYKAQDDLGTFSIEYVDGTQIAGTYFTDTFGIGDTSVTDLTMAAAQDFDRFTGIMGVGFAADESSNSVSGSDLGSGSGSGGSAAFTYPNIINVLKDQGKIDTLSYSLWLDDLEANTGSILFGGVDKDKYTGSLGALPIQKDGFSNNYTSFAVAWTGLSITGSGNNMDLSPSAPQAVILDSGTSLTYLPDDITQTIFDGLGVVSYGQGTLNTVPCSLAQDDLVFTYTFGGSNGISIKVNLAELVVPYENEDGSVPKVNGKTICRFGISAAGSNPLLFGDTFLRSAYVVYDLENLQIGLAQANFNANSGAGNVEAITSGIPDVTKTADGASVVNTYTGRPLLTVGLTQSGNAGAGTTATRSVSFKLTATAGGSSSNGKNAAGRPTADNSALAILAVTVAAFIFGAMLI